MDNNFFAKIQTKERSANFTKVEMQRLQSLVAKHKNILFSKKTDGISSKQKENAWNLIECEFNALGDTPRSVKQLKYKFENLKRVAKKVMKIGIQGAGNGRQEMCHTEGGPSSLRPPSSVDGTDCLRSITLSSFDENEAVNDDDTLNQTTISFLNLQPPKKVDYKDNFDTEITNESITEESQISKVTEFEVTFIEMNEASKKTDASTPNSSLKRPISIPLRCQAKKGRLQEDGNLVWKLRAKKIAVKDNLQELELKKISDSILHAQEIHDQKLRHNEERHQLELEKIKLEIETLKKNNNNCK
ncbi:unnamed protein product [Diatraea saccharalis]|uniref:Regulatory protein zeste n=1 Tax=Diatraea saccharalis TaxID=40085 RepID=A0A9N9WED8_9NEOP|nr:unnamed protein product [Diatraea saccharalis]